MYRSGWSIKVFIGMVFLALAVPGWAQTYVGSNSHGDGGLFNLFGSQTVGRGKIAGSVVFDNFDRDPLDVDETDYRVGLSFGILPWLSVNASWDVYRVQDIDPKGGIQGFFNGVPVPFNQGRSGTGDAWLGLKAEVLDVSKSNVGLGLLGRVKIPIADDEEGVGTGQVDLDLRGLLEINANDVLGIYGNVGALIVSNPEGSDIGNRFLYGVGVAVPYNARIQLAAELSGAVVEQTGEIDDYLDVTAGLRFFITREVNLSLAYRRNLQGESDHNERPDGAVFTLGYWPQREVLITVSPEELPPPPPPPTIKPELPPPPPPPAPPLEEVYFAFDRYDLRPSEIPKLDRMVQWLKDNPNARIVIEGHTCYIGTDEYNMALGAHRAEAIKQYFVAHGIAADRIETISYGETRPKYDNSREITRRFNRRGWFVVRGVRP